MATAHELDDLNNVDLEGKLREAKEELFNLRFQAATGQLESHGRLRAVKRDIARIYTVIRERELGIRATPVADEVPAKAAKKAAPKKSEGAPAPEADTEIVEEAK
jgi:large subunit ribosomal protein L29